MTDDQQDQIGEVITEKLYVLAQKWIQEEGIKSRQPTAIVSNFTLMARWLLSSRLSGLHRAPPFSSLNFHNF